MWYVDITHKIKINQGVMVGETPSPGWSPLNWNLLKKIPTQLNWKRYIPTQLNEGSHKKEAYIPWKRYLPN